MDKILPDFEQIKISVFSKYSQLTGDINNVTIGPNRTICPTTSVQHQMPKSTKKKVITWKEDTTPEPALVPLTHVLREFEMQRKEKVQKTINDHLNKYKSFSKIKKEETENQWLCKQQAFIRNVQDNEQMILQSLNQPDVNKSRENEKLIKQYQDRIQRRMQLEQQLEQNKEKQRILTENVEKIKKNQIEFKTLYEEIVTLMVAYSSNEELKSTLGENFKLLKSFLESFEDIISKCKSYTVDQEQLSKAANIVLQIKNLKIQTEEAVSTINTKKKDVKVLVQSEIPPTQTVFKPESKTTMTLSQCISVTNLKRYAEVKQFLAQHSGLFSELLNDEHLKQFRFDCKKAVNIPVNALSAVSSEHLKDKYIKLNNLLLGKTVSISERQINASRHPQGVAFCMDLLAKKLVLQGDLMISSNPEAAFCYATIIISLWNDFPDFGRLVLGYFYTQCPYLVPFYIPRTEDQTDEEYYTNLGYYYIDGQIEKQDKFLKRMTGILRLYFAITIANPKRGQTKNPHDIRNAWNFISSIIKLDPQLEITATAIHIFLETVGFEMDAVYGLVFKKIVKILTEEFMPLLKKFDSGGPVSRLEVLLQDYKVKGHFEKPNGLLGKNFW